MEISYLVPKYISQLNSCSPFFIGVSPNVWHDISKTVIPTDIFVYDIDNKVFLNEPKLPILPEPMSTILITSLESLLNSKEKFTNIPNVPFSKIVSSIIIE